LSLVQTYLLTVQDCTSPGGFAPRSSYYLYFKLLVFVLHWQLVFHHSSPNFKHVLFRVDPPLCVYC